MPDVNNPQGGSQNPASESPTVTGAAPGNNPESSTSITNPSEDELKAIRHDAKYRERRAIVNALKAAGHEVTEKSLNDYLKTLKAQSPSSTQTEEPNGKSKKEPKSTDNTTQEPTATEKLLRKQIDDLTKGLGDTQSMLQANAIEAAISRATLGVQFANDNAAGEAITLFQIQHQFELSDDKRSVRVLDVSGEPMMENYKELTVRQAFDKWLESRPHLKKATARPGQNVTPSKGMGGTEGASNNDTLNAAIRRAAGLP